MNPLLFKLTEYAGRYEGEGVNHEKEKFVGSLEIRALLDGRAIRVEFEARSLADPARLFHSEVSTIAVNSKGGLSLFNLNTNTPFLAELPWVSESETQWVFRFGSLENKNSFREEVRLEVLDGKLGYHYSWGLPGGEFAYRSGALMKRRA